MPKFCMSGMCGMLSKHLKGNTRKTAGILESHRQSQVWSKCWKWIKIWFRAIFWTEMSAIFSGFSAQISKKAYNCKRKRENIAPVDCKTADNENEQKESISLGKFVMFITFLGLSSHCWPIQEYVRRRFDLRLKHNRFNWHKILKVNGFGKPFLVTCLEIQQKSKKQNRKMGDTMV